MSIGSVNNSIKLNNEIKELKKSNSTANTGEAKSAEGQKESKGGIEKQQESPKDSNKEVKNYKNSDFEKKLPDGLFDKGIKSIKEALKEVGNELKKEHIGDKKELNKAICKPFHSKEDVNALKKEHIDDKKELNKAICKPIHSKEDINALKKENVEDNKDLNKKAIGKPIHSKEDANALKKEHINDQKDLNKAICKPIH